MVWARSALRALIWTEVKTQFETHFSHIKHRSRTVTQITYISTTHNSIANTPHLAQSLWAHEDTLCIH